MLNTHIFSIIVLMSQHIDASDGGGGPALRRVPGHGVPARGGPGGARAGLRGQVPSARAVPSGGGGRGGQPGTQEVDT